MVIVVNGGHGALPADEEEPDVLKDPVTVAGLHPQRFALCTRYPVGVLKVGGDACVPCDG